MNSLTVYVREVYGALRARNGETLANLLSSCHNHATNSRLLTDTPEAAVRRVIDSPWDDIVIYHLKCVSAVNNSKFTDAYKNQAALVQSFTKIFQSYKDDNWALPIMYAVCLDLRLFASKADTELSKQGNSQPGVALENAAELLMSCFRVCASDNRSSTEDSKRWGMLYVVNQLFKIYYKINKLHLCKPLIRAIDSSNLRDQFTIAQLVTYKYYVGRKAMFDNDFKSAEEYLTFAFQKCHKSSRNNKRFILIYLIPVKMLLGHMPSMKLLEKYDLMQFAEVAKAVMDGNLLRLNEAMAENEVFFIRCGIYLILEKLKIITYRNLFKKVYLILKTHQIPVASFLAALKFMQVEDIDLDEVHCILANLIYEGKIKGYLNLQHNKLVVSKQNAFPPLSALT